MTSVGIVLLASLVVLLVIGVPVAYGMGLAAFLAIIETGTLPTMVFAQRLFTATNNFPLMAIIFFMLAGELMMQGGISKRLINLATALLGGLRGNLALISVMTCALFSSMSGSALATTAAVGGIMCPEMVKRGYKGDFAAALQAVSGTLGILFPPAIPLVIYGVLTGVSIGDLFLAVIGAGFVFTILYMGAAMFTIMREGIDKRHPGGTEKRERISILAALKDAIWGLLTPVIILGGIYSGIFTPTESAIVACVYALIVGVFVYREINLKILFNCLGKCALSASSVMFIIATATLFGWVMTAQGIPVMVSQAVIALTDSKIVFLLLVNLVYLVAGMFMETATLILILVPLFLPVAMEFDISPLHFGIITIANLSIGLFTPPFGATLFVAASVSRESITRVYLRTAPFVVAGLIGTLLVTFVPALSLGILALFQ